MSTREAAEIYPLAAVITVGTLRQQLHNGIQNAERAKQRSNKRIDQLKGAMTEAARILKEGMHSSQENMARVRERVDHAIQKDVDISATRIFLGLLNQGISGLQDTDLVEISVADLQVISQKCAGEVVLSVARPSKSGALVNTSGQGSINTSEGNADDYDF